MGWVSGIVVYLLAWWMILFMVLPWGSRPPPEPEPGHATSAPARPRLRLKLVVTTGLAVVAWFCIYLLVEAEIISFRALSQRL